MHRMEYLKIHVVKSLFILVFVMAVQSSWAQDNLTYTVNITDRSKPDNQNVDLEILVEANFIAGSNQKQKLRIKETGLDVMTLQASLINNAEQKERELTFDEVNIEYRGTCNNPLTQQANVLFVVHGDAVSVDTNRLVALQFNEAKQQLQVVDVFDVELYDEFHLDSLLVCAGEQRFVNQSSIFMPCNCAVDSSVLAY